MIEVGDKVRHWSRGYLGLPDEEWMMFGSAIGPLTVVRVIELDSDDWKPEKGSAHYYNIVCALPPPCQQECHYSYFTVRSTRRSWQYRANGTALHIVARAQREPVQGGLFA